MSNDLKLEDTINTITIRCEERKDWLAVEKITREAFWRNDRIKEIGIGATEHYMVHMMRGHEGIEDLTFVAEGDGEILGHIIYTNSSHILKEDGSKVSVLNFGPICVKQSLQKQGIGSQLMKHSMDKAKELGYGAIFFFGHPEYYPRFGFKEAKEFGITTSNGENFSAFMGIELQEGYLEGVKGQYFEADIYNETLIKLAAKEYDKTFID